jgi:hypothetical protein
MSSALLAALSPIIQIITGVLGDVLKFWISQPVETVTVTVAKPQLAAESVRPAPAANDLLRKWGGVLGDSQTD